jgi:hypothetical protein
MTVAALWMPILLSAILVFAASSLIHMVLKWHKSEYRQVPGEEAVRASLRGAAPGQYMIPYCAEMSDFKKPEVQQKFIDGPIAFLTMRPNGLPKMGPALGQWFLLCVLVSAVCAYLAGKVLPADAQWGQVTRVVGLVSFVAYGFGSLQYGIWMGKPWKSVAMDLLDAFIYAVLTAAAFCWLW